MFDDILYLSFTAIPNVSTEYGIETQLVLYGQCVAITDKVIAYEHNKSYGMLVV